MIVGVYALPLRNRFRGIDVRHGLLLRGPAGWAEFSPFEEYTRPETDAWRAAALEAAELGFPAPVRDMVPVNVTVPAVDAATAHRIVTGSGCTTAKVKVAEPGQPAAADLARVEAVRDALGPSGAIRVDANGAWSPEEALGRLRELARFGLEYAEQPCASVEDLARLRLALARRGFEVPIAADESIRRSGDPERVVALEAADIAVLKVQPLGGVRRCLELAERLGLPVVVSSALESSVGLRAGVALAAALPELPYACGLNTATMFTTDVTTEPLVAVDGAIAVRPVTVDGAGWQADAAVAARWVHRWEHGGMPERP
jgi:O-succinylbenzoate synthase